MSTHPDTTHTLGPAAAPTADPGIDLYTRWADLWNGLITADALMAPRFRLRYAQAGAESINEIDDPATFTDFIGEFRAQRAGIHYTPDDPVLTDMGADGTGHVCRPYLAVIPATDAEPERRISGTDILRAENGRIVEVWSVSSPGRPFRP
ncbi:MULTISPECIES: hypothetical protein [Gordonia]|uniref:hypothetical protein n=1 Tax=Gordonia TaxID=2053 RepID=UPI0009ABE004|nr:MULTISPECIES: hypothetical protein [Gordonia]MBE7192638.1 hypothetical protein [Gordonia polyisoprenivorans]MDF3280375.1 hypothetical protein [Gordonia sp. N1V]OPX14641.1 hypothetical protein B1964_14115 [Gordonia sp. i37]OZC31071.1 hypothetical protein CJJ17_05995 [Gordonia polyisoprenivorans]